MRESFEFQAGTYFIGDPCYAIPEIEWDDFLAENDKKGDGVPFQFKGKSCWFDGTDYGDGTYTGSNGVEYSVDAGIIGVTPIELATKYSKETMMQLGSIETFEKPFFVSCEAGNFQIGKIRIETSPEDEDDEDE